MAASQPRFLLIAIIAVAMVLGGSLGTLAYWHFAAPAAPEMPEIGGPFELTAQGGEAFSSTQLEGKPFAVFFGFTHCPEVCPTTLYEMSVLLEQLGPEADDLRVLFVSVDPERDTAEFLERYLQSFDPRIVGLTGSEDEIAGIADAYKVFYEKVPLDDGDYTMNHTASVYLMDADGDFTGTLAWGEDMEVRLQKLQMLVRS